MMHFGKFSISHKGRQNESFKKKGGRGERHHPPSPIDLKKCSLWRLEMGVVGGDGGGGGVMGAAETI